MSNRIYRIKIIKPEFEKLYKKYELLAHGLEEIAKYSKKEKKVKLTDSGPATQKTSTDYVVEALNYFKDEYNKARLTGIIYEYNLGPNFSLSDYEPETNEINHAFYRAKAIEQLHKIGFVKKYTIENRVVDDYGAVDDYAICEIEESKITQKEAPPATEAGIEALTQTVIHKHFFENSIQEKAIDLNIKKVENNVVVKNNKKRVTLPKFPRAEWVKVSIKFIDEGNILLSDTKNTKPSTFEGMGCEDTRDGKPDDTWKFLLRLAIGNGQTPPISKTEREKQKKQKQKITDILKKIFQNDSEPFETESGGVYKAKFNIEYSEIKDKKPKDKFSDIGDVFSEMTEPVSEEIEDEFSQ